MNIFETVKASVPPSRAAERYGLKISRGDMVCCPFHIVGTSSISFALPQAAGLIHSTVPPLPTKSSILREPLSHPSMKLCDDHFHCFGCQATGDVIEFASKLFGITVLEAAQKLAADFGTREAHPSVLAKLKTYQTQAENEKLCFRVLQERLREIKEESNAQK